MLFISSPTIALTKEDTLLADGVEYRLDLLTQEELLLPWEEKSFPQLITWKEETEIPHLALSPSENKFFDGPTSSPHLQNKIISKHFYANTPKNLEEIFEKMCQEKAFAYKIATFANSTLDALKVALLLKKYSQKVKMIALCMGEKGTLTRILSPVLGNFITFASLNNSTKTAPGQLSLSTLLNTYNYRSLNQETKIYGLIGNPVSQSIGHIVHNIWFKEKKANKVYIKMELQESELKEFFDYADELGIKGLSVTMPFKEKVIPFLDEIDEEAKAIGAINTIVWRNGKKVGYNTDGIGALNAIESHFKVFGKKIILLGAGGASRAIAYEAIKRGAFVVVISRSSEKGEKLVKGLHSKNASFLMWDEMKKLPPYDLLINATPSKSPLKISHLDPTGVYMDIDMKKTAGSLFSEVEKMGWEVIYGEEMFIEQALLQQELWEEE